MEKSVKRVLDKEMKKEKSDSYPERGFRKDVRPLMKR